MFNTTYNFLTNNSTVVLIITIICLIYGYFKNAHSYWESRNVPCIPGYFPFGSISSVFLKKQSFIERINEMYSIMKDKGCKYCGIYFITRKALLVIDPELVKKILITDFQYFHDRGIYHDEKADPLSAHLVALSGDKWKHLRQKLSPTFTTGKLKNMFEIVLQCGENLGDVLKKIEKNDTGSMFEMKDLAARYTIDVIGSCAFGIECNSLKNPDAEFRKIGRKVFESGFQDRIKRLFIRNSPWFARKMKMRVIKPEVSMFFTSAVSETIAYRRQMNIRRSDFLQLLMELMDKENADNEIEKGSVKLVNTDATAKKCEATKEKTNNGLNQPSKETTLTMNQAAAHAFVFFLAGFETSASTITFALYEITRQVCVQDKVRKEIFEIVMQKYNGKITYDGIMEMQYMEQVLLETMRKYPTFVILMRKCTKEYTLPDSTIKLEEGIPVIIPVHALHHDPEYYPEPDHFNPDRFQSNLDGNKKRFEMDNKFLPFGAGPRICIGLRFAMIQMKVALTIMLLNYKFTLNEKTDVPLKLNPASFVLSPLRGTWLNLIQLSAQEFQSFKNKSI